MADEKRTTGKGRPPKHPGNPDASGRTGTALSIRIDPELRALITRFIADFKKRNDIKPSLTDVVEMGLRRLFREEGLLPKDAVAASAPSKKKPT